MGNFALMLFSNGQWKEAEELETQVMETRKTTPAPDDPDTLISMHDIASNWKSQSRHRDALVLIKNFTHVQQRVLGL